MAKKYKNTVHKNPFREDRPKKASPLIPAAIIALSANAFTEDREKSRQAGMDDHIEKPIKLPELYGAMRRVLK